MKTIFSNKAQKAEKAKLKDFRQDTLLPTSELQLRTAMACRSNILKQQMSLNTVEERKFITQVINSAFSLFLLPALHLSRQPITSPILTTNYEESLSPTKSTVWSLFHNKAFGILQNSSFIYIGIRVNTQHPHCILLNTTNLHTSSSSYGHIPENIHFTLH